MGRGVAGLDRRVNVVDARREAEGAGGRVEGGSHD
jgi:hypothetical protein